MQSREQRWLAALFELRQQEGEDGAFGAGQGCEVVI